MAAMRYHALSRAAIAAAEAGDVAELTVLIEERERLIDELSEWPEGAAETEARLLAAVTAAAAAIGDDLRQIGQKRAARRFR